MGNIDWDQVTFVLYPAYQRRWNPRRRTKSRAYANADELKLIMNRYQPKLYVFVSPVDAHDRRIRDAISIALIRVAQKGNVLARTKLTELVRYTVEHWIENQPFFARWREYEEEIQRHVEGGISRYRYTGSFIRYLYKTLEYAARGIRPLIAYSLDEPLRGGKGCRFDLIDAKSGSA